MKKLKYTVATVVIVCAGFLIALTTIGPKIDLQSSPIEPKAKAYLEQKNFLEDGEKIVGYKATSYYSYSSGVVITNKRMFGFYHGKMLASIPLNKITMVIVKDLEFGRQEILISAGDHGIIMMNLNRKNAKELIMMMNVPLSIVKHFTKHEVEQALKARAN